MAERRRAGSLARVRGEEIGARHRGRDQLQNEEGQPTSHDVVRKDSSEAKTRTGSKIIDRALKIAEELLNEAETTSDATNAPKDDMIAVDRELFVDGLDKLTDELWLAGEEHEIAESDDRFEVLSVVVADFLRDVCDKADLRRALEDCYAEVPPR